MVLLQTVLIVLLVYYGLKILLRWLGPKMLRYALKKTGERFGRPYGPSQDFGATGTREGETTVEGRPVRKSNPSKKVGEYIDFEEID
jgi:hypothetical protein